MICSIIVNSTNSSFNYKLNQKLLYFLKRILSALFYEIKFLKKKKKKKKKKKAMMHSFFKIIVTYMFTAPIKISL